ncbi:MAG: endonuclease/exonuclease/phosphatase family protein [Polyangiales bacterium]
MTQLRIATYNVHGCVGVDGRRSVERIVDVLRRCEADVIALQELFVEGPLGGPNDQPSEIAKRLGMQCVFTATAVGRERRYGHGLLARKPVRLLQHGRLPTLPGKPWLERRSALLAAVGLGPEHEMHVLTTHLGLDRRERLAQADALLGMQWLGGRRRTEPLVVCGDLNCMPYSRVYRRITGEYRDVQEGRGPLRPRATWPSVLPVLRIDHLLVSRDVEVRSATVGRWPLARVASDHLPVIATIDVPEGSGGAPP